MAGMLQILTYLLAFYLVMKGVEILQIALCSARENRGGQIAVGVIALVAAIAGAAFFVSMQDNMALSLSRSMPPSSSSY